MIKLAFAATEEAISEKVLEGPDRPILPPLVSTAAPCQEVMLTGKGVDITRFPIPTYSPRMTALTSPPAAHRHRSDQRSGLGVREPRARGGKRL
jgi:hypothetical protein